MQGLAAALTPRRGRRTKTRLRKSASVTIIAGMKPVIVPCKNAEYDK